MNKRMFIPLLFAGLLFPTLSFNKTIKSSYADGTIEFDTHAIQALSHKDGVTVNFLNSDMVKYWNGDATDIERLKALYENNREIESFANNAFDHEYTRNLYAKWDDFKPVNNTLTWRSNISVDSFDVVVSLNAELTEALYEEKGLTTNSYTLANPYANTHYFWQVTAHSGTRVSKSPIFDFYSGDYKRTVDIPSISNTRDIGGFTGSYGTMKQGLIYRSGRLDDIDDGCQTALQQLDIQTDLDLRNDGEGAKNPANLAHYYLKTLQGYTNDLKEENRAATVEAVRVFADPNNYPVIFHCTVGRDRTGTLAILLQALSGASKDYIIHDYYSSMWSVTGAYQKSLEDLNLSALNETFSALEAYGDSLSSSAENFLKKHEGSTIGLTNEEIQSIRDIWSGKISVEHGMKTFKASENYEGKVMVSIKAFGHQETCLMVNKGTTISAPYELESGLMWYADGKVFDFATPINDTTFIYADYTVQYVVTIHFVGIARQDEIIRINSGETISFTQYAFNGFNMIVLSDEGTSITELVVSRDVYINIIYAK